MSRTKSASILMLVAQGLDIGAAVDKVLGAGKYEKLASDLRDIVTGKA